MRCSFSTPRHVLHIILLILLCNSMSLFAKDTNAVVVSGVSGNLQTNVEKRLRELQQLKPLSQFTQEELQEQVRKALQPFGYFNAEVHINLPSIRIRAGTQVLISHLTLKLTGEGAHNPELIKLLNNTALQEGIPFNTEEYNKTKLNFIEKAESLGYMRATFKKNEILIDKERHTAEITLIFDTGTLYYFGQAQFDPTYIRPELLHRFVPFQPGQSYSGDSILKLNNDLANSGYFNSVLVKPHISDNPTVPVTIHLQPVPKYSYTLGAGYGTDTGVRGRAALHVIPVNNRGHKFNALAQGSFVQNALQAQYVIPGSNPITDQYTITGNFSNLNYSAGYSNAWLLSLAEQHHVAHYNQVLSVNSLYEGFHYNLEKNTKQLMFYPKGSFSFINNKNILFSPSGFNITFNGLGASTAILSTTNFAQVSMDAKAALRIESLRLRLYGHAIHGYTAINDINQQPLSLALLLGGTDNLKAYSFNSIGPGHIIRYIGFEIQKETKKNWYVVGFYDAGDVYNPDPQVFKYDAGLGLMWVSPIGPIKVGLAQEINNRWQRTSHSPRLVISMGPDL